MGIHFSMYCTLARIERKVRILSYTSFTDKQIRQTSRKTFKSRDRMYIPKAEKGEPGNGKRVFLKGKSYEEEAGQCVRSVTNQMVFTILIPR